MTGRIYTVLTALLLAMLMALPNPTFAKEAVELGEEPWVEVRMLKLSEELRCLVCQNETLASSRAELANDLRAEVRNLVKQGKTDTEIKDYLVARYGDFVLYSPEVKPITWLLWFGPFAVLIGAVGLGWWYVGERNRHTSRKALSAHERARAEHLLNPADRP